MKKSLEKKPFLNERGVSLVEIMIASGVMMIVTLAFTTMMVDQQKETRFLTDKLAALDLEKNLISAFTSGDVCKFILNNPTVLTFDSTAALPQYITLPSTATHPAKIFSTVLPGPVAGPVVAEVGQQASVSSKNLVIESIKLQITSGVGNIYAGSWVITFDNTKLARALMPIAISSPMLTVDKSNPSAAKITDCGVIGGFTSCSTVTLNGGSTPVTASCPSGYTVTGGGCSGFVPAANSVPTPTGWYCSNTSQSQGGIAYVVCCR